MKEKIHPRWYPEAKFTCVSCGTEWTVGAAIPEKRVDICANCHPFYTGEQRIVDTEGQVDRFMKRLQQRDQRRAASEQRDEEKGALDVPVSDLDLGKRYEQIFADEGYNEVGDLLEVLQNEGDEKLLEIPGIGRKVLSDIKKKLRARGYEVAAAEETTN